MDFMKLYQSFIMELGFLEVPSDEDHQRLACHVLWPGMVLNQRQVSLVVSD